MLYKICLYNCLPINIKNLYCLIFGSLEINNFLDVPYRFFTLINLLFWRLMKFLMFLIGSPDISVMNVKTFINP